MPMQRLPTLFHIVCQTLLFALPARKRLTMPLTQMRDKPEGLPWAKPCHI